MPGITTPYNLQMPSAGLIGRGSGAGRSTIMDAAAVRAFTNAVNKAGDTMTGALVVENSIKSCRDVGFLIGTFAGPGTSTLSFFETANIWLYDGTGSCRLATNGTQTRLNSDTVFGFSSGSPDSLAIDTPIVRAAAGVTAFRNSTTAQQIRVSKTYTSDTNCEYLSLGFSGTNFDVVSKVGSAGGTNQPIRLGHIAADGTTFAGVTVATSGAISITASGSALSLNPTNGAVTISQTLAITMSTQNGFVIRHGNNDNVMLRPVSASGAYSPAGYGAIAFGNTANAVGVYLTPTSTGTLSVRTAAHSDAALTCGAITASGAITPATLTDAAAPLGSIYYSSTASKLVYKDAGGTVNNLY